MAKKSKDRNVDEQIYNIAEIQYVLSKLPLGSRPTPSETDIRRYAIEHSLGENYSHKDKTFRRGNVYVVSQGKLEKLFKGLKLSVNMDTFRREIKKLPTYRI